MRVQTYCDCLCDICNDAKHDLKSHHITGFFKTRGKAKGSKVAKGTKGRC